MIWSAFVTCSRGPTPARARSATSRLARAAGATNTITGNDCEPEAGSWRLGTGSSLWKWHQSIHFQSDRHSHSPAHTERRQAAPRLPSAHLIKQCDDDAGAGAADGVSQRDGAAVDVQLLAWNRFVTQDGKHLRCECFVQFHEIEIVHR